MISDFTVPETSETKLPAWTGLACLAPWLELPFDMFQLLLLLKEGVQRVCGCGCWVEADLYLLGAVGWRCTSSILVGDV